MNRPPASGPPRQQLPVLVRDNRRIAPATLQPGNPDRTTTERETEPGKESTALGTVPAEAGRDARLETQLAERTADLQRLKAEYDNYRKRVQRDRLAVREIAVANVLAGLLPVLDAIDQARNHGAVTGGLKAVAEALESRLGALGLETVGTPGAPFDPTRHEAVTHEVSDTVDRPTCTTLLRRGYRVGRQLLRPAQVAVTEPKEPATRP
ncbi:nucleotide exchange factor GrpE [Streptomyces pinistramenti]|uniref:nucleotide exchange factor GrpE n=1 Tax=Streptomyces pinistramenti TaxID=2884812 RepID=UPI001D098E41|nr:nucleotide exchange factor GrpE [Streptomyces pinistramenti]MCB5908130.1 nucleotide exchange factor GrpE [Streptomyces pinistramenti]